MSAITEKLRAIAEEEYADFQAKLTPTSGRDRMLGVRVPLLRDFAKKMTAEEISSFLTDLPHTYYDENLLHSILLERAKPFSACVEQVEAFLPYVDNWAVCDTLRPKVFASHKREIFPLIEKWIRSSATYTCRFGLDMLMTHFLDGEFSSSHLVLAASVTSEEYYVRMMAAWYFATALAKQWDAAIPYLEEGKLDVWTHNKTIRKAIESYRITPEQKTYLRTLKK